MKYGDFIVEREFVESEEVSSLSATQFGIMMRLFSLLAMNRKKELWGFLIDAKGTPLSERKIRRLCGAGKTISFSTWNSTKQILLEKGIIKTYKIKDKDLLYCQPFVNMNKPDRSSRKAPAVPAIPAKEFFLGFDPKDQRADSELDTWERLMRQWLILTESEGPKLKPPFTHDMPLKSKEEAKSGLVDLANTMGIDNAVHDMMIAFEFKKMAGGLISSMFYFITRWKSDDWHKRHVSDTKPHEEKNVAKKNIKDEAEFKIQKGVIKTYEDFLDNFKYVEDKELLKQIGRELRLNGNKN